MRNWKTVFGVPLILGLAAAAAHAGSVTYTIEGKNIRLLEGHDEIGLTRATFRYTVEFDTEAEAVENKPGPPPTATYPGRTARIDIKGTKDHRFDGIYDDDGHTTLKVRGSADTPMRLDCVEFKSRFSLRPNKLVLFMGPRIDFGGDVCPAGDALDLPVFVADDFEEPIKLITISFNGHESTYSFEGTAFAERHELPAVPTPGAVLLASVGAGLLSLIRRYQKRT